VWRVATSPVVIATAETTFFTATATDCDVLMSPPYGRGREHKAMLQSVQLSVSLSVPLSIPFDGGGMRESLFFKRIRYGAARHACVQVPSAVHTASPHDNLY